MIFKAWKDLFLAVESKSKDERCRKLGTFAGRQNRSNDNKTPKQQNNNGRQCREEGRNVMSNVHPCLSRKNKTGVQIL